MKISVVVATYNRGALLSDLLHDLAAQENCGPFDVIIVDDGSVPPARPVIEAQTLPYAVTLIEQSNAGQAKARHVGVLAASGDIIVIVDDDMSLPTTFLAAHATLHQEGAEVVLGLMRPADDLAEKPLFERFHAAQLDLFVREVRAGKPIPGSALCTGNVSFRRQHYMQLGGFDQNLKRSEDRDLGIRLQKLGARFAFSEEAYTRHRSDHNNLDVWKRRAFLYGVYDHRIAQKHPEDPNNDPWHYLQLINPISRPIMLAAMSSQAVGKTLSNQAWRASELCAKAGLEGIALKGATLVYGLEYFQGVRSEYPSMRAAVGSLLQFLSRARSKTKSRPAAAASAS